MERYKTFDRYFLEEYTDGELIRQDFGATVVDDDERQYWCTWSNRRKAWVIETQGEHGFVFVKKVKTLGDFLREYGQKVEPIFIEDKGEWACGKLIYRGHGCKRNTSYCTIYAKASK